MTASWATCVWHCIARVYSTSGPEEVPSVHMADSAMWWDCCEVISTPCAFSWLIPRTQSEEQGKEINRGNYVSDCEHACGRINWGYSRKIDSMWTHLQYQWKQNRLIVLIWIAICCNAWQLGGNPVLYEVSLITDIIEMRQASVYVHTSRKCAACWYV